MSKNVTAKVVVSSATVADVPNQWNPETQQYDLVKRQATVFMYADYADGRNAEWAAATPTMQISTVVNGDVSDLFPVGQRFTLTFTPDSD